MLLHDIIKIKYVKLGYIVKNFPYHLISDEEMFNAFIEVTPDFPSSIVASDSKFFDMNYPNPFADIDWDNPANAIYQQYNDAYYKLKNYIIARISDYLKYANTTEKDNHLLPSWIYTYMLGEVVYSQSDYLDIQDTLELLGCSNLDNEFTLQACIACYNTSLRYVSTLNTGDRPPSLFGEPHVIKILRMGS
jgi:hypothetical protein